MSSEADVRSESGEVEHDDIMYPSAIPFVLIHLGCFAAIWTGITLEAIALCVGLYWLRIFAIGAGYHRYFSHRAYSTSRAFQFVLAVAVPEHPQKSVLWWAAKHRHHHLHSDTGEDVHSPRHKGFIYSHVGWIFSRKHDTADLTKVADLARYPELMWLHKYELVPAIILAALCFLVAGWPGLVVGFLWSTVLVYHATFCINSLAHVRGSKRYVTGDDSRNNLLLGDLHHGRGLAQQPPRLSRQRPARFQMVGDRPDLLFPAGAVLVRAGVGPQDAARAGLAQRATPWRSCRQPGRRGTRRSFQSRAHCASHLLDATRARIDGAAGHLVRARHRTSEVLQNLHLPHIPSREEFLREAKAKFARTRSLEEIVDRAHELLLAAVGTRLAAFPSLIGAATEA